MTSSSRLSIMTVLLLSLLLVAAWAKQLPIGSDGVAKTNVTEKARSGCDYPFEPVGNGCYFYSEETRYFSSAQMFCKSIGHGYDVSLATFGNDKNQDEAVLITAAYKDKTFWVGANTEDGENWQWIDERPVYLQSHILDYREPNEVQNKCMVAQVTVGDNSKRSFLFDYGCEESMNFICQIGCPFEFRRIGKYCYFISEEAGVGYRHWQNARDYCEALNVPGGYHADLAVLDLDDQDTDHLMNSLVAGYSTYNNYWLGAVVESDCVFKWVDGRDLPCSSHYWCYSQPGCGSSDRVYMHHDTAYNRTYLYDTQEDEQTILAFICQMFKN